MTDEGEEMLVSSDESISGPQLMHRYLNSDAYMSMIEEAARDNGEATEEDDEDIKAIDEALDEILDEDYDQRADEPNEAQLAILAIVSEDVMLDNIQRITNIIENLTDEQVKNLGPEGVEEVFIALSKFYYTYMQNANPLWEVAQARYRELKKWQNLYMEKYYRR